MSDYAEWIAREARENAKLDIPKPMNPLPFWVAGAVLAGAFAWDLRAGLAVGIFFLYERLMVIQETLIKRQHEEQVRWIAIDEVVNRLKSIQIVVNPESRKSMD